MRHEQPRPNPRGGAGTFARSYYVSAERARRDIRDREMRDPLMDIVDLAKDPGLLYRLHAMLNG